MNKNEFMSDIKLFYPGIFDHIINYKNNFDFIDDSGKILIYKFSILNYHANFYNNLVEFKINFEKKNILIILKNDFDSLLEKFIDFCFSLINNKKFLVTFQRDKKGICYSSFNFKKDNLLLIDDHFFKKIICENLLIIKKNIDMLKDSNLPLDINANVLLFFSVNLIDLNHFLQKCNLDNVNYVIFFECNLLPQCQLRFNSFNQFNIINLSLINSKIDSYDLKDLIFYVCYSNVNKNDIFNYFPECIEFLNLSL